MIWEVLVDRKTYDNYEYGFPREDSPALEEMMAYYLRDKQAILLKEDSRDIFQLEGINQDHKRVSYAILDRDKVRKYYSTLRGSDYPASEMDNLLEDKERLYDLVEDPLRYNLPRIQLENYELRLETNQGYEKLDLLAMVKEREGNIEKVKEINLASVNDEDLYLQIRTENEERDQIYHLFMKQDLSDWLFFEHTIFSLKEFAASEDYHSYKQLFYQIDRDRQYVKIFDEAYIIHSGRGQLEDVYYYDLLSDRGDYSYSHGSSSSFSKGQQIIQRTGDAIEESDNFYAKFRLSYRNIVYKSDWPIFGSSEGRIVYFSEDMVLLRLNYEAKFPKRTYRTNVIIDLQEDKQNPSMYLIDLGIVF